MSRYIKYFLFGFVFLLLGMLAGFKIKGSLPAPLSMSLDEGRQKLYRALDLIERSYVETPNTEELIDDAMRGMLDGLDPHSVYIPASELQGMEEELNGAFEGIGIQFNILEDTIFVETPLAGGPSEKLGILAGDRIVRIEGENVAGIGITNLQVTRYLKGEKGTQVKVSILRRGIPGLLEFEITRDRIPINSVDFSYMVNAGTGYIRITRFAETTYDEFMTHLRELKSEGMEDLILDLRGNPGGYLSKALTMTDEFLKEGQVIVSTVGRDPDSRQVHSTSPNPGEFETGGLVILLDYGSASASEIVSGAVQDHDRGIIAGVRSFGKGMVQIQEKFADGSALRLVISKYYSPSGRCIQKPYSNGRSSYAHEIFDRFESGEVYDQAKASFPDSLLFHTDAGRDVYGGGGIFPDVFVPTDTTGGSAYLTELRTRDLLRRFAAHELDNIPALASRYPRASSFVEDFELDREMEQAFIRFSEEKGVPFVDADFAKSGGIIRNNIKAFIGRQLYQDAGFYPVLHQEDNTFQRAVELIPAARRLASTGQLILD